MQPMAAAYGVKPTQARTTITGMEVTLSSCSFDCDASLQLANTVKVKIRFPRRVSGCHSHGPTILAFVHLVLPPPTATSDLTNLILVVALITPFSSISTFV